MQKSGGELWRILRRDHNMNIRQLSADQLQCCGKPSPDINPIEKAWAKLKVLPRAAQARTRDVLEQAIADALKRITPDNAKAWFRLCKSVYGIS
jgi:hypothetical protein